MNNSTDRIYFPVPGVKFKDLFDWSAVVKGNAETIIGSPQKETGEVNCSRKDAMASGRLVHVNDTDVALFRFGDAVFGINERCPHAGGPLHIGDIEVLPDQTICVRCPWHSWKFNIMTGKSRVPIGRDLQAETYDVLVNEDGDLKIEFKHLGPSCFSEDF